MTRAGGALPPEGVDVADESGVDPLFNINTAADLSAAESLMAEEA